MSLSRPVADWRSLRAVVLQSDDWGFPGWSARPADRPPAAPSLGRYVTSTLETAEDVVALGDVLAAHTGGDGRPAVLQANYVVMAPDFERLLGGETLYRTFPDYGSGWERPGLMPAVEAQRARGVLEPEHHGALHCDIARFADRLRRRVPSAVAAAERGRWEVEDEESHAEYTAPLATLEELIPAGVAAFRAIFGRSPVSTICPNYVAPPAALSLLRAQGIDVFQALARRPGARLQTRARRALRRPVPAVHVRSDGATVVERAIDFEPLAGSDPDECARRCRREWEAGRPAIVSTHRVNYVGWDEERKESGRRALARFLGALPDATFLTDSDLVQRNLEAG